MWGKKKNVLLRFIPSPKTYVSEGKEYVYDRCRRKKVVLTPEERVRQSVVSYFRWILRTPLRYMQTEVSMKRYGYTSRKDRADLLILLSDINGLYTDNPSTNPDAKFVPFVDMVDDELKDMGKESASGVGTGGMATKLIAAELATSAGADMVIANGRNMNVIHKIIDGQPYGTFFRSNEDEAFELKRFLKERFHE